MQQHTEAPWRIEEWAGNGSRFMIVKRGATPDDPWITIFLSRSPGIDPEEELANVRFVIDCANKLAGYDVEHLEAVLHTVQQLVSETLELGPEECLEFREQHLGLQNNLMFLAGLWRQFKVGKTNGADVIDLRTRKVQEG